MSISSLWVQLERREQVVVIIGVVMFALGSLFFFVLLPLESWRSTAVENLDSSQAELNEVRQLVAQIQAQESMFGTTELAKNLSVLVDTSLRKNNLSMRGFQPGNDNTVRLRLEEASFSAFIQWLYELEYEHNVTVLDLSITPSRTPGRSVVSIRISQ